MSAEKSSGSSSAFPLSPPSLLGKKLGQYQILEKIGQGGMGTVFKALDTALERTVALKVLYFGALDDPKQSERFLREARSLAKLTHPNLVHVYNVGNNDECFYFTMELLEGETLTAAIRRRQKIASQELIPYVGQVLSALHYVHQQAITHRDIKSGNIMLAGRRAVLMDFGLAKMENSAALTAAGSVVGTPEYMSPEAAHGEVAGPPTDIYSLGVVLYEALSGTLPFTGKSAMTIIRQHLDTPPPPLESVLPSVEPFLAAIVHKCLAKKPEERYANCSELAADLVQLQATPELSQLAADRPDPAGQTVTYVSAPAVPKANRSVDATVMDSSEQATLLIGEKRGAPSSEVDLANAPTLINTAPSRASVRHDWRAWAWMAAGFFGVIFLAIFLSSGKHKQSPGQPAMLKKTNGESEEIRWIGFKSNGSDPSHWYHIVERRAPNGEWTRAEVPQKDFAADGDTLEFNQTQGGSDSK